MENPWLHLRNAKDEEIPLFASALLIAKDEYPQLADASYKARLREYTRRLRKVVNPADPPATQLRSLDQFLFEDLGFRRRRPGLLRSAQQLPQRRARPAPRQPDIARRRTDRTGATARRSAARRLVSRTLSRAPAARRGHRRARSLPEGPFARCGRAAQPRAHALDTHEIDDRRLRGCSSRPATARSFRACCATSRPSTAIAKNGTRRCAAAIGC